MFGAHKDLEIGRRAACSPCSSSCAFTSGSTIAFWMSALTFGGPSRTPNVVLTR